MSGTGTHLHCHCRTRSDAAVKAQHMGMNCQGCPDAAIKEVNIAASVASAFYSCAGAVLFSS